MDRIKVEGMSCGGCVRNVTGVLKAQPGVREVDVSLETRGQDHVDELLGALREQGYLAVRKS